MAGNIDWGALAQKNQGNFKNFADPGTYKVPCIGVEIEEVGVNGSVVQKFQFEEGDVQYPTADHWLSFNNDGWRQWHNKQLMVLLGASEENAKKAVEMCESKDGKDNIVKAYEATYKKLLAKKPTVEIEVFADGKYSRADFASNTVRMNRPDDDKPKADATDEVIPEDIPEGEIDMSEIPF